MKQAGTTTRTILLSSLILMLGVVLLKVFGFAEKLLLGRIFGAGDDLDAYFVALKISLLAYFVLRGILRSIMVPLLTSAKNESLVRARDLGISLALLLVAILGVQALGCVLFTPQLVDHFAPGFSEVKRQQCIHLTRWLLPSGLFLSLTNLLTLSLHVRKRFALAALGDLLQKGCFLAALLILVAPLGIGWIPWAYCGSVLVAFIFLGACHLGQFRPSARFLFAGDALGQVGLLAWPLVVGGAVSQLGGLVQTSYASGLGSGSITALTFAQTAIDLPLNLVPLSLSVVLLPYFAEFSDRKDAQRSARFLSGATRFLLITFIPLALFTFLFREPIAHVLFKGGRFNQESVRLTVQALAGLAPGLPFMAIEMVFMNFFFASKRMVLPMVCGLVAMSAALACLPLMERFFYLAGVSAFLPLSRAVKIVLLTLCLPLLGIQVPWRRGIGFMARLSVALLPVIVGCFACRRFLPHYLPWAHRSPLVEPAITVALLSALYLAALCRLRFSECTLVLGFLKRMLNRLKRRQDSSQTGRVSTTITADNQCDAMEELPEAQATREEEPVNTR